MERESVSETILEGYVEKDKFTYSRKDSYNSVIQWIIENELKAEKHVEELSFIARAYFSVGTKTKNKAYIDRAKKCVETIKTIKNQKGFDIEEYFGDSHNFHRAYFAIKAIKEIEGNNFNKNDYSDVLNGVIERVNNADKGWSKEDDSKSDVESTASAIKLLSLLGDKNNREVSDLVKNGVNRLIEFKGDKQAWGEDSNPLDVHTNSHAVRAIIYSEHFIGKKKVSDLLTEILKWLENTQNEDGGWCKNEQERKSHLYSTALGFITLNVFINLIVV
jgi:prenyltransferase beta subunit